MDSMNWQEANELISKMNEQDFGSHNDWRLPSVEELITLFDYKSKESIADQLIAQGYIGVQASYYWSSTTCASNTNYAWYMYMGDGYAGNYDKTSYFYVWPVRSRQSGESIEFLKDLTSLDSVK